MIINLCAPCRLMLIWVVYLSHERRLGGGGSGGRSVAVICYTYFFVVTNIINSFIWNEKMHCHNFVTYTLEVKMLTKSHNMQP